MRAQDRVHLPPAVDGERRETTGRAGRVSYYVAGNGQPVLLVHSVNAAASAYEMRPIFERVRDAKRVYAMDLPGFGFSDRAHRRYDVRLFVDAIHDMLEVIAEEVTDTPVHVTALSLASEFAARAATEQPGRFRTLSLITPTGFNRGSDHLRQLGATREVMGFSRLFEGKPWSRTLYGWLTSRASIRYFLRRTYGSREVDEGMVDYDALTARQPGAHYAPLAFLSGRLFSKDVRAVYENLQLPVWLGHGTRGDFKDFSEVDWTRGRANWTVVSFPSGALPHFEVTESFFDAYLPFIAGAT